METRAFALLLCFLLPVFSYPQDETIVTLSSGVLQGTITDDGMARAFRGVPYAAPPVGALRWNDPQPVEPWSGVYQATVDGAACMQTCALPGFACPPTMNEDCLYLNVFTPRASGLGPSLLPVMMFVHGGNFFQGYGGGPLYDARFAANTTSTIVVTINYRLGLFGFLASPDFTGNYGLLDQIHALRWIQQNIEAFGGDPKRVTLFGQSAGAMSASVLLYTPISDGLFSQVIMESQPFGIPFRDVADWGSVESAFASLVNCSASDVDCLTQQPADAVLAAQDKLATDILVDLDRPLSLFVPFTPVIGSNVLPKQPLQALLDGDAIDIPIILGNTAQEAILFVYEAFNASVPWYEYYAVADLIFNTTGGPIVAARYPPEGDDTRQTISLAATDGIFLCPNRNVTRTMTQHRKSPMWYYIFDHPPYDHAAWGIDTWCYNVSCHGVELPFVFHSFFPNLFNWTQAEAVMSTSIVDYWTNFAHSGDPNVQNPYNTRLAKATTALYWPAYTTGTSQNMHFSTPANLLDSFYNDANCTWWDNTMGYVWP